MSTDGTLRRKRIFTDGELNKGIDALIHPLAKENPMFWAVDTFLHGMVEQDPELTVRKFIHYTALKIIKQMIKQQRQNKEETRGTTTSP